VAPAPTTLDYGNHTVVNFQRVTAYPFETNMGTGRQFITFLTLLVSHLRHLSTAASCVPVQFEHQSMTTHTQTQILSIFLQPAIFSGCLHENRNLWVDFCPPDAVPVNGLCVIQSTVSKHRRKLQPRKIIHQHQSFLVHQTTPDVRKMHTIRL